MNVFHCLRHGHATHALEAGVPMKVVQQRLGHSSIQVTADIYSHVTAATDQAAADKVAAAIDGS
jgi:integrase